MAQAQSRYAMGGMVLVTQFSATRKRFMERMGRDLVLLTVSFDPNRGTPERLADRQGAIAASIEGNQYAAGQLGDLIETVLRR